MLKLIDIQKINTLIKHKTNEFINCANFLMEAMKGKIDWKRNSKLINAWTLTIGQILCIHWSSVLQFFLFTSVLYLKILLALSSWATDSKTLL